MPVSWATTCTGRASSSGPGTALSQKGVERTIQNVGLLAKEGMRETDREIFGHYAHPLLDRQGETLFSPGFCRMAAENFRIS